MYKNLKSKEEIKMIALGCDQGGFALKQEIMAHLKGRGLEFKDYGSYDEQSVDPNGNPLPFKFVVLGTRVHFNRLSFIEYVKGRKR